jgi:hypothetical protein
VSLERLAKYIRTFEAERSRDTLKVVARNEHAPSRFADTPFVNKLRGCFAKGFIESCRLDGL